ncbi:MAG: hypothetical protein IKS63_02030, partial [Firmicutes bacterium]|nr:hypothetical protein [Bacillota bacterium]
MIALLSVLVVVLAVYMLILPAKAIEKDAADAQGGIDTEQSQQASEDKDDGQPAENAQSDDEQNLKSGTLVYNGDGYTLSAKCDKKAGLPEDIELTASEIKKNSDKYDSLYEDTLKALQNEKGGQDIKGLEFVR